jgi:SAM-dependent methyltransferase
MNDHHWSELPLACPRCRGPLVPTAPDARCGACNARYRGEGGILRLTLGREGAPGYDPHHFRTLERVEDRHFWFVARREIVLDSLRRSVPDLDGRRMFDIGCGTGGLLQFLAGQGVQLAGACDAYPESLEIVRRRLRIPLVLIDEGRLPPLGSGQELLALFDVLEHVDDDREMLGFLHSILEPGGIVVLTVPAHPALFSERDDLACHRRRYRRGELERKLEDAGFTVRLLTHFMAPLAPLLLASQLLSRVEPRARRRRRQGQDLEFRVLPVLNGLMRVILAGERRLLHLMALPFGSSLIAVGSRPGKGR